MRRFVFVGGLQRSGTTLLGRLLAQHPDMSGLVGTGTAEDEGQFVQNVYPDDHRMGAVRGSRGQAVAWGYHQEAHLTERDLIRYPDAGQRLVQAWEPYLESPAASVVVEKSPSNVAKTRFLEASIPGSCFVIITRHPIVQALAVRKWGTRAMRTGLNFTGILDHWLHVMGHFSADRPQLERVTVCSYEELVSEPKALLERLHEFIGVPRFETDVSGIGAQSERYSAYWNRMSRPGLPSPLEHGGAGVMSAGRRLMETTVTAVVGPSTVRRVRDSYADSIAKYGYDIERLSSVPRQW